MTPLLLTLAALQGAWVPISDKVTEGLKPPWPGLCAGIAVDAGGDVYLAVSGLGLWKSSDRGATFEKIDGGAVGGRGETGAAISVDPEKPGRLQFFMLDGKSARTLDGGKTWTPCNDKSRGFDYVAVDWADPLARRCFGIRHESGEIGLLSADGGATWTVLDKPWKAYGVFDFDTLVTWRGKGIERSTDAGKTWAQVSDVAPTGRVMMVKAGVGYWLTAGGLVVSRDKGATWTALPGPSNGWFGPWFGKTDAHLMVYGKDGFVESKDAGATWAVAVPPVAEKGLHDKWFTHAAWDPKGDVFYISRMGKPAYKYQR